MRKTLEWEPRPIEDLGDLIGYTVWLKGAEGSYSYQGGLRTITEDDIHLETEEGQVLSVDRAILMDNSLELFTVRKVI